MKGESIPLISRLIRVADSIDAMSSSRPYKNKLSIHEIVEQLQKYSGNYYDPNIIPYAINVLNRMESLKITDSNHENKIYSNASISLKDYNNSSINSFSGTFQVKSKTGYFKTRVASGLVLESKKEEMIDSNLMLMNEVLEITLDETVDTLHLSVTVNVKVLNTFFMGNKMLIKCNYLDLKPQDTDVILKVLFRKQAVLKRSLFKG